MFLEFYIFYVAPQLPLVEFLNSRVKYSDGENIIILFIKHQHGTLNTVFSVDFRKIISGFKRFK